MASPSLFLSWPQEDSPTPPPPKPRSKTKRGSKSSSIINSKKLPQRGLGVAKLEQIRLQNNKISFADGEQMEAFPMNQLYGAPIVTYPGSVCCVPQFRVGYGPVSAIRSVLHEQYAMDRDRALAGVAAGELPSNQTVCLSSDLCQLCARKKRVLREDLGFDAGNGALRHFATMDEERRNLGHVEWMMGASFAKEREIKEYDFFPHNSIRESNGNGGDLVLGDRTVGGSPSSAGAAANYVDLSLKLL